MRFADFYLEGEEAIIAAAIHNGHHLHDIIAQNIALSNEERMYEEDPYTCFFTQPFKNRIIANYSRFEADLNRPEDKAFYIQPQDAWGLKVRKQYPSTEEREFALSLYRDFYSQVKAVIEEKLLAHKLIFVYDLHSYNHQRMGQGKPFDDPAKNPEIILGTNNMPRTWLPLVESVKDKMQVQDYFGRKIDVRINVKFPGGHFSRWLHSTFPQQVICIALEFKKIFMNEWTGEVNWTQAERLREILASTKKVIRKFLSDFNEILD